MNNWNKLLSHSNNILFLPTYRNRLSSASDANEEHKIFTLLQMFLGTMGNYVCDHKNYSHRAQRFQARANDENSTVVYYCDGCGYSVNSYAL